MRHSFCQNRSWPLWSTLLKEPEAVVCNYLTLKPTRLESAMYFSCFVWQIIPSPGGFRPINAIIIPGCCLALETGSVINIYWFMNIFLALLNIFPEVSFKAYLHTWQKKNWLAHLLVCLISLLLAGLVSLLKNDFAKNWKPFYCSQRIIIEWINSLYLSIF